MNEASSMTEADTDLLNVQHESSVPVRKMRHASGTDLDDERERPSPDGTCVLPPDRAPVTQGLFVTDDLTAAFFSQKSSTLLSAHAFTLEELNHASSLSQTTHSL